MISPYVRRLRLGTELRALRAAAGLTHEQVAQTDRGVRGRRSPGWRTGTSSTRPT